MSHPHEFTITLDRRLLEHPRAFHLRRMRASVWLYLDLLARLPAGATELEIRPAEVATAMGLPEGTIRSWLGHLRAARYIDATRLDGATRIRIRRASIPDPVPDAPAEPQRFFTIAKVERALGESDHRDLLEAALDAHPDAVVQRALAGALAVPATAIRRSRTALFLYLLKRHAHEQESNDPRP